MAETHESVTVIGPDTFITGEMQVDNRARILGRFEGTIRSKGQIEIADKASCKATLHAGTLQIDGSVEGNITAVERVHLNATAKVKGDLVATKLIVAEGASFSGHVTVGPEATRGKIETVTGVVATMTPAGTKDMSREPQVAGKK